MSEYLSISNINSIDTNECNCLNCNHCNTLLSTKNTNNKYLKKIVNRLINKTKINSIHLINNIQNYLPAAQTSDKTVSTNRIVYKPFNRFQKLTKLMPNKRVRKPQIKCIDFDFSTAESIRTDESNSSDQSNAVKLLPWENSLRFRRKNKKFCRTI